MKTVSLRNRRSLMLPPIHLPELGLESVVVGTNDRDGKSGAMGRRKISRSLPTTVTLCARGTPGDSVGPLPAAAASSPEVLAAVERGDVEVTYADVEDEPRPTPKPAPEPPPTAQKVAPKPTAEPKE